MPARNPVHRVPPCLREGALPTHENAAQPADADTLLRWSERILTAASLDELFV